MEIQITSSSPGSQIQKEHSSTSQSSEMEVSKDYGNTKILEKASSFQSEEKSMVVEESQSQSVESSSTIQSSVSSSVTSAKKMTSAVFSSSSSFEMSEGDALSKAQQATDELDPGPAVNSEPPRAPDTKKLSPEIEEGKIKNTLKEIISEIDNYVQKDETMKENGGTDFEHNEHQYSMETNQDGGVHTKTTKMEDVHIKKESFNLDENEHKPVDLEKIFTPADDDEDLIQPNKNRKMFASSSFYSSSLHPTVEDQVQLARRISSSLCDISNQKSKGQSMYVNRKKRSVKWVHEGEGKFAEADNGTDNVSHDENKHLLKLVMDPRGQIQDLGSLRRQGYTIDPPALSPDVCMDIVRDLNAPNGKGAELFAKRRKKAEKWVVSETSQQSTQMTDITSSSPSTPKPMTPVMPGVNKMPVMSYLDGGNQRVQHTQKLDEIQERFSRPKVKLIKSPWEAALETGSVDAAFQDVSLNKDYFEGLHKESYEIVTDNSVPSWTGNGTSTNGVHEKQYSSASSFTESKVSDSYQKSYNNTDLYKPKLAHVWTPAYQPQSQYSYDKPTTIPNKPPLTPSNLGSYQTYTPYTPPSANIPPTHLPQSQYTNVYNFNNYNTAPRGWGEVKDFYRPVTFNTNKTQPAKTMVYTDF